MSRSQPYTLEIPDGLTDAQARIVEQIEEMFEILFADVATAGGTVAGAALTRVNDTNVTITLTGTPTTALLQAVQVALGWTGQLSQGRGGTGKDTSGATDGQVLIGKTSDHTLNLATLTAGAGITITNGGGTITIAATNTHTQQYVPLANGDVGNPELIFAAGDVVYVTVALP